MLINEMMARRFWPDANPIGGRLTVEGNEYQVIGVVQDGRINDIHEPLEPYLYFSFAQRPRGEASHYRGDHSPPSTACGPDQAGNSVIG